MQRMLLALLACAYSAAPFAQLNVNVTISGIDARLEENVRLFLSVVQHRADPLLSEGRLQRLHKKAPEEIGNALQPFGYYRPVIQAELTQVATDEWQARYVIDAGPPLPIGEVNIVISEEMAGDPEFQALLRKPPLRKGRVFNHLDYEEFKANLARLAAERGYFKSRFVEHRVEVDLDAYEARIYVHYDGGPRYRFGEVSLQQEVLDDRLLRRYITFKQGDPYSLDEMISLQHALNNSDYFQTIEVSPAKPQEDSTEIPINVMLTPRKPNRYSMGLGYGTDTGARAKFGWEKPRLNRRGHRLNTEVRISEIGYSLGAQYRVPILNPRTDQLVYSAGIVNEKTDSSDSTLRTIGASINRGRGEWRESVSLNYQREEFEVAGDRGTSTLFIPGVNWSRTWGQSFIYTLDGLRFDIGLRGASQELLSDTDFAQLQGGVKTIYSLGQRNRIILRGRLGSTYTQEFHQLPPSVRFFAGGAQSVRGYAYQSLGPVDSAGEVVGGKNLMVGSVEFERRLGGKWGVALFYDAGNAIDDIAEKLERGAGFGMRWQSPVGPVRIDLASAISKDGQPWRLHINIGPDL
ncbi:MAG: autotransporter assembly complex family protein [Gammaproteobacteria bacterium]|nr:autotransporter assembly complex family protein [Gammaproteobacteria bacterium]